LLKFRRARQSDKKEVLKFCSSTFDWGDYIEQVWDVWCSDPNGYFVVVEDNEVLAAVSHAYVCPYKNRVWLEGVRVNPDFRRRSIGTDLIKRMIQYGMEQGAHEAAGLVSVKNVASQAMMKKNGFVVTSAWSFCYSSTNVHQKPVNDQVRIATLEDRELICTYLKQSQIFRAAAENYAHLWRWYHLDLSSDILRSLIGDSKIIIMTNHDRSIIQGLTIINEKENNIFQIGYIDALDAETLRYLIAFVINLGSSELREKKSETLQMFIPNTSFLQSAMTGLEINQYGHFLLYRMDFS
jgi:GNAT superfamily N-acetyltransferase